MKIRSTAYGGIPGGVPAAGTVSSPAPVPPAEQTTAPRRLSDEATVMGIPEHELTPKVRAAIGQLFEEVQSLRGELDRAKKRIEHLERLADQDTLTPILNRRAFVRELSRLMSYSERYGVTSAVLYFDVNGMKQINDNLGHGAGDAALAHVADVLSKNVRGSDAVGRLGGDEFGVILAQADEQEARQKAAALADGIHGTQAQWHGRAIGVQVSYGAHMLSAGQGADDALNAADQAMYAHKRGRASGAGEP